MAAEIALPGVEMADNSSWRRLSASDDDLMGNPVQASNQSPRTFTFPQQTDPFVGGSASFGSETSVNESNSQVFPSSQRRARTGRKGVDSVNTLPAFEFNPGTQNSSELPKTMQAASTDPPNSPSKSVRHRRSTSEFIGADGRSRASSIRSISPSKSQYDKSVQSAEATPSYRGHRHRRSGAMSSSDLSAVDIPVYQPAKAAEAPPLSPLPERPSPNPATGEWNRPKSNTMNDMRSLRDEIRQVEPLSPTPRSPSRIRVGFSDTLEFIPRPLSFVSSESGSSMSTLREPMMAESIHSVLSGVSPTRVPTPSRGFAGKRFEDTSSSIPRPKSADSAVNKTGLKPAIKLFDSSHFPRPKSAGASTTASGEATASTTDSVHEYLSRLDGATKAPKKRNRIGQWASSFLRSNEDSRQDGEDSTPRESISSDQVTSPTDSFSPYNGDVELDVNFDGEDPTGTLIEESGDSSHDTRYSSARGLYGSEEFGSKDSMIDLDAAIEPLGSPHDSSTVRGVKGRSFSAVRHRMHSSGLQNGSGDFGRIYHRRAESAPQLNPPNLDDPGAQRLISSSASEKGFAIENVFEEEEEESSDTTPIMQENPSGGAINTKHDGDAGAGGPITDEGVDMTVRPVTEASNLAKRRGLHKRGLSGNQTSGVEQFGQLRPLITNMQHDITIVPCDESFAASGWDREASTVLPPLSKDSEMSQETPFKPPRPLSLTNNSVSNSTTPSSRRNSAKDSLNAYRLDTASSLNEPRKFAPFALTEPGPEVRLSVDDVPSLVSSRSTMTSGYYSHLPSADSPGFVDPASSTTSLPSVPSFGERHRKRPSMVSLTRLMGSSVGNSKLSVQQNMQSTDDDTTSDAKEKKRNRLGRLFKFWKVKEEIA